MAISSERLKELKQQYKREDTQESSASRSIARRRQITGQQDSFLSDIGQDIKQTAGAIKGRFQQTGQELAGIRKGQFADEKGVGSSFLQSMGAMAGGVSGGIGDLFTGAVKGVLSPEQEEGVKQKVADVSQKAMETPVVGETIKNSIAQYQKLQQENPELARNLESLFNIGMLGLDVVGGVAVKKGVTKLGAKIGETAAKAKAGVKEAIEIAPKLAPKMAKEGFEAVKGIGRRKPELAERFLPKLTEKTKQRLFTDKAIQKGKESFVFGKSPDIVLPSEKLKKASDIIEKTIPDADKLDDFKLGGEINDLVTDYSKKLTPQMKKVDFTPDNYKFLNDNWNKMIKTAKGKLNFETLGGKAVTKKFDEIISKLKNPYKDSSGKFRQRTMDDVWKARIEFDKAVGKTVRNADDLASDMSQFQNDLWHEYRRLLNDLMINQESSLGQVTKKSFQDMSSLSEALTNLKQTAKIDVKGGKSLIGQLKKPAIKLGAGYVGVKGAEQITGIDIPGL